MMEMVIQEIRQAGMIIQKVIDNRSSQRKRDVIMRVFDTNTGLLLSDSTSRRKRIIITS